MDVNRQIDLAVPLGLQNVKVTGGEPLLFHNETMAILHHASRSGVASRLETNGLLVGDTVAAELAELGTVVTTSLDGASPEAHDAFRHFKGAFERTRRAVETLVAFGVTVEVVCCVHRNNSHEVNEVVELCDLLGISYVKFNFPPAHGRAIHLSREGSLLSASEVLAMVRAIEERHPPGSSSLEIDFDVPQGLRRYPKGGLRCDVMSVMSILPDGRYSLCGIGVTHKNITFGTMSEQDIDAVWRESVVLHDLRTAIMEGGAGLCGRCTEYEACLGHCAACAISEGRGIGTEHPLCRGAYEAGLFPTSKLRSQ